MTTTTRTNKLRSLESSRKPSEEIALYYRRIAYGEAAPRPAERPKINNDVVRYSTGFYE